MIVGIGNDLVDCRRIQRLIEKFGDRFITRVFTPAERQRMEKRTESAAGFAKIFAAKEAVLKAIGTGMTQGINWQQIEIQRDGNTPPRIVLSGIAKGHFDRLIPAPLTGNILLSLSDEWPYALAFVVISAS